MPVLANVNLWVGLILSLVGTVTVAPKALPQLGRMVKDDWERLLRWLRIESASQ